MKKNLLKTMFLVFVLAIVGVVGITYTKAATAPKSVTVKRAEILSDYVTDYDHGFTIFTTNDGKIIYCLDVDKTALKDGQSATLSGTGDSGLLYLLENGYPNKKITGNTAMDKYITQGAIWWYMDATGQGGKVSSAFKNEDNDNDTYGLVPNYIKPLVDKAINAKNSGYSTAKASVNVNVDGDKLTLSSDEKYYESPLITANLKGTDTYTVSVSGGTANTKVVDENGNAKDSFKSGEKFKIRIPANELTSAVTLSVKVNAKGSSNAVKIYSTSDSSYQRVVGLFEDEQDISKTVTLTASPNTSSVEVSVPNTSANIIFASVIGGVVIIAAGVGLILYRSRKNEKA